MSLLKNYIYRSNRYYADSYEWVSYCLIHQEREYYLVTLGSAPSLFTGSKLPYHVYYRGNLYPTTIGAIADEVRWRLLTSHASGQK